MGDMAREAAVGTWSVRDVDEITEVAHELGWDCSYCQLESGTFESDVRSIEFGDVIVDSESWSRRVHVAGCYPDDTFQFQLMPRSAPSRFRGRVVRGDEIIVAPPGSQFSGGARTIGPDRIIVFRVAAERARSAFQDQHRADAPESAMVVRLAPTMEARLRSLAERSLDRPPAPGIEQRAHENSILSALVSAVPHGAEPREPGSEARRAFRLARDYVRANLGDSIRIEDLCRISGIAERTLRRAFHRETGVGPIAFVRAQRLCLAQRLLKSRRVNTVTEAALRCGITEFGRFAASYRAMFGQLPSATLGSGLAE